MSVSSFHIGVVMVLPSALSIDSPFDNNGRIRVDQLSRYQYSTSVVLYVTVILERAQIDLLY